MGGGQPMPLTGTLRMDWQPRIFFPAFTDDAEFASTMRRRAPPLVRLWYVTSDKSHIWSLGMRQIGQGNFDRVPRIVVARVLFILGSTKN